LNINLHIESLVLDGLPVERRHHALVQHTVETELARLLAGDGLAANLLQGGAVPNLPAGSIRLAAGTSPVRMGQQIARAVYSGIGR
jgi:hypothetical protein